MASKPHNWSDVPEQTGSSGSRTLRAILAWSKRVWAPLEYSSAYLAAIAAVEVLIVQHILALPSSLAPVVVGLITFAIYANDRLVDLETDAASNPRRTAFVRQYHDQLYALAAVAYGLAVALAAFGGPLAFVLALVPGAAWVLYAVDWVPDSGVRFQRLKELLIVNSAVVAAAWALVIVLVPVAFAKEPITATIGVIFAYFLLGAFVSVEISNVGDIESDRQNGVATMPVVFGTRRTRQVLYGVGILTGLLLIYSAMGGMVTARAATVLSIGVIYLLGVISLLDRVRNANLLTVAAEAARLPVFVLLALLV